MELGGVLAFDGRNYLETPNPFGLARPPLAWLAKLWVQDDQLVLFPSMQEPAYVLARRVIQSPGILRILRPEKHPDLVFCQQQRLLGVTGIQPFHTNWNDALLEDLRKMDTWRCGGIDKFTNHIEQLEAERAAALDAVTTDEGDQRSASAWFAKGLREGATTFVQGFTPPPSNVLP